MRVNLSLIFNQKRILVNCIKYKSVLYPYPNTVKVSKRFMSTKDDKGDEDTDKPIQYSSSAASKWKAINTHGGTYQQNMPWFQPISILGSISIFLIYFCILREENDIDEDLDKSLWEKIPGLEKKQIKLVIEYNKTTGDPIDDLNARLKELESIDKQKTKQ